MKITGVKPWLIKSSASYWGEFLFIEVTTDEGVSGWGEITTTTKLANRALCSMLRQIGSSLVGEDPGKIMDSLGLTRYCCRRMLVSQVDIIDDAAPYA